MLNLYVIMWDINVCTYKITKENNKILNWFRWIRDSRSYKTETPKSANITCINDLYVIMWNISISGSEESGIKKTTQEHSKTLDWFRWIRLCRSYQKQTYQLVIFEKLKSSLLQILYIKKSHLSRSGETFWTDLGVYHRQ